jgi:ribosomal protein S18 acetylase RimI-like enzyme
MLPANISKIGFSKWMIGNYFNNGNLDGIICVDEWDDRYILSNFFVNESLQRQGLGQYLFRYVLDRYNDKKIILYVHTNNNPAIHIYKKYGFKITGMDNGRGVNPESPHYIMTRDVHLDLHP